MTIANLHSEVAQSKVRTLPPYLGLAGWESTKLKVNLSRETDIGTLHDIMDSYYNV